MAADYKKSIAKGKVVVLVIPNEQYTKKIIEVTKYLSDNHKAVCYISLNKMVNSLSNSLKEAKIDPKKFFFIDGITKSANPNPEKAGNCCYISSSSALTELSIAINDALKTGKYDCFLFDSLSTLLIYNKGNIVSQFTHSIINKIKSSNATAVFTALEGDTKSDLLKEISMFVDEIVHVD